MIVSACCRRAWRRSFSRRSRAISAAWGSGFGPRLWAARACKLPWRRRFRHLSRIEYQAGSPPSKAARSLWPPFRARYRPKGSLSSVTWPAGPWAAYMAFGERHWQRTGVYPNRQAGPALPPGARQIRIHRRTAVVQPTRLPTRSLGGSQSPACRLAGRRSQRHALWARGSILAIRTGTTASCPGWNLSQLCVLSTFL